MIEKNIIYQPFQVNFEINKQTQTFLSRSLTRRLQKPRKKRFKNEELVNRVKGRISENWELDLAIRRLLLTGEQCWRSSGGTCQSSVGTRVNSWGSSGGNAVSLALFSKKFGDECNCRMMCLVFLFCWYFWWACKSF